MSADRERDADLLVSIVEDDPSVSRALTRLCRAAGFTSRAFASAGEFLSDPETARTACLVLDVHLRDVSGLELLRRLLAAGRSVPTCFITAFDDDESRQDALAAGALGFLPKPLDTELLLEVIRRALESREVEGS